MITIPETYLYYTECVSSVNMYQALQVLLQQNDNEEVFLVLLLSSFLLLTLWYTVHLVCLEYMYIESNIILYV
jgi:hypothetical protein